MTTIRTHNTPAARVASPARPAHLKDRIYRLVTLLLGWVLVVPALLIAPRRPRAAAAGWALTLRFPHQRLAGLTPQTRAAFVRARSAAFWQDRILLGVTSGHREPAEQDRLFRTEVVRTGSEARASRRVLPAAVSAHVAGTAIDVRPREGAAWLEYNGHRFGLYRTYDNEWWHFEFAADSRGRAPLRWAHPGQAVAARLAPEVSADRRTA